MAELAAQTETEITYDAETFGRLPPEIVLRLSARALTKLGNEGPVELGKLEALLAAAAPDIQNAGTARFRRSLAGALFSVGGGKVTISAAPPRRNAKAGAASRGASKALTTGRKPQKSRPKSR